MPYYEALRYDALRQLHYEDRLHHEVGAGAEHLALQARDSLLRRACRLPLARKIGHLRTTHRDAMQRAGYVVVTVWPRR